MYFEVQQLQLLIYQMHNCTKKLKFNYDLQSHGIIIN